jgi:hypothetical protein
MVASQGRAHERQDASSDRRLHRQNEKMSWFELSSLSDVPNNRHQRRSVSRCCAHKGAIDTTDLTSAGTPGILTAGIQPDIGFIAVASGIATGFAGISGPSTFGPGGNFTQPTNSSGDAVTISISEDLGVPDGYTSGSLLSDTSTYDNATFASLGMTPGTYEWTWGTGAHADSFTLQTIPEPSTWALMLVGFGLLGGAGYWTRRRGVSVVA